MKSLFRLALPLAALLLVAAPSGAIRAQAAKPIAVVSLASLKENLADIGYVTKAAGMEDAGKTASFFASALASGIDRDRPIGLYFVPQGSDFHGILFVPLEPNGLATLLKVHRDQLGEPKNVGNGIQEVGKGRTVFIKEQAGWAFASDSKEQLNNLPQDPLAVLGDLPKTYNVAMKVIVQNIPEKMRRTAIDEIKLGMERFLSSPAARQGNIDRDQVQKVTQSYLTNLERLINEADEILFGIGLDEATRRNFIDVSFSAKDGTSLAKQMALQTQARTNFAGFLLPEASVTVGLTSKSSPEDVEQIKPVMQAARQQWAKQIDDSPDVPADKREATKAVLNQFFDIFENTISTGVMDGAGALVLLPKSISFVAGGLVADGAAVEKAVQSLVEWGKGMPDFPQIQMNVGTIGNIKLHRLTAQIPEREREARDLLGNQLEVLIGTGPKSVVVAGGKDPQPLLQKVLAASAQQPNTAVPPLQINVSLLPILRFYRSVDQNPGVARALATLEAAGNDRISIVNTAAARSSTTRIEIQEGVIKAGGEVAKALGAVRQ